MNEYERLRAGDPAAREQIILANWGDPERQDGAPGLVERRVDRFLRTHEWMVNERDDLFSQANVKLIEAIDVIAHSEAHTCPNVKAYLTESIDNELLRYFESAVYVPYDARVKGVKLKRKSFEEGSYGEGDESLTRDAIDRRAEQLDAQANGVASKREAIFDCCSDDIDRVIVTDREDGLTDAEIGDKLSISARAVCKRRARIEARYDEYALGA